MFVCVLSPPTAYSLYVCDIDNNYRWLLTCLTGHLCTCVIYFLLPTGFVSPRGHDGARLRVDCRDIAVLNRLHQCASSGCENCRHLQVVFWAAIISTPLRLWHEGCQIRTDSCWQLKGDYCLQLCMPSQVFSSSTQAIVVLARIHRQIIELKVLFFSLLIVVDLCDRISLTFSFCLSLYATAT